MTTYFCSFLGFPSNVRRTLYMDCYHINHYELAWVKNLGPNQFMSPLVELLREGRWWWGTTECSGPGLPTVLLLLLLAWCSGVLVGFLLGGLAFSSSCRKLLVFILQALIGLLGAGPVLVGDRTVALRTRLSEYRSGN